MFAFGGFRGRLGLVRVRVTVGVMGISAFFVSVFEFYIKIGL